MKTDYLIFLLSVDWAREFLSSLLNVTHDEYSKVLSAARKEARNILDTAPPSSINYLHANFSNHRVISSWNAFLDELKKAKVSENTIKNIDILTQQNANFNEDTLDVAVLWMILLDSLDDYLKYAITKHDQAILIQMRLTIENIRENETLDLKKLEFLSDSDWDMHIKSSCGGIPTVLSDFASINFQVLDEFKIFWIEFLNQQSKEFRLDFFSWLISRYELITETKATLPNWLK